MHKLYLNSIKDNDKLSLKTKIYGIGAKIADKDSHSAIIFLGQSYEILKRLPNKECKIIGYIHADAKAKETAWNENKNQLGYHNGEFFNVYDKPQFKTAGYLKSDSDKEYFAVTTYDVLSLFFILPLFLAVMIVILFIISPIVKVPDDPIFGDDITSEGEITSDQQVSLDPVYFNVKINATPILEKRSMNIRIENSKRNIYNCHVKIFLNDGENEKVIYNSPLITSNHFIEYATIKEKINTGVYKGEAVFTYFDGDKQLETKTKVKLIINSR